MERERREKERERERCMDVKPLLIALLLDGLLTFCVFFNFVQPQDKDFLEKIKMHEPLDEDDSCQIE